MKLVMIRTLHDVAVECYSKLVQLTYRPRNPSTEGFFNVIIYVSVAIKMGCKNCDNVSLEDYENAMFAHLITERNGKWYVRTDSGIIKEFTSHTSAKEFIFMGGVQDGNG